MRRRIVGILLVLAVVGWAVPSVAATINGGNQNETIEGTPQDDLINAGNGNDIVHGLGGNDTINGGNGNDGLWGDEGNDLLNGANGNDEARGGDGHDTLVGENGNDSLWGEAGNDSATGANGNDIFDGGVGHDTFSGDAGNDTAQGGAGLDLLRAASGGNDQLDGGADNDAVVSLANTGTHTLKGGVGNDIISGTGSLQGGDGNDVLISTATIGDVNGGTGTDICVKPASVNASGCETILNLGSSGATPTLAISNGPAEGATVTSGSVTINFTKTNSTRVWCVADTGAIADCATGTFTADGLANGDHAIAIVAAPNGSAPAAAIVRHFTVAAAVNPAITTYASPAADTVTVAGTNLTNISALRLHTADGDQPTYTLPDERVTFDSGTYTIIDVNLGRGTITKVEALDNNQVVASKTGSVQVASSITLQDASSNAASSLVITGTHFTAVDRITLVHDTGTLNINLSDPGVVVSDEQIIITSTALDGLHLSEIQAIRLVEDAEIMDALAVDITIQSSDTTPPAITTPGELMQEASGPGGAQVPFEVTGTDAVDGDVSVTCDHDSGDQFPLGETTVTCAAEDAAGNDAETTFLITVADTTGPAITVPASIDVDTEDPNGESITYEVSADDLVDGHREVVCQPASGSRFPVGVTVVLCESSDIRGNTSATSFNVTVRDTLPPVLALIGEPTAAVGDEAGEPVDFDVTATDAVDGTLVAVCNPASGSRFTPGEYPVHCEARDAHGNVGSLDFTLTVALVNAYTSAEAVITEKLPHVFEEGYSTNLPMSAEQSMPDAETMIVDTLDGDGQMRRVIAKGLFGYVDSNGQTRRIDTNLVSDASGFAPTSVPYSVTLPNSYAEGVRWSLQDTKGDVRLFPLDVNVAAPDGQLTNGQDHVLYPSVWTRTDLVATTRGDGVSEHLIARSTSAPRAYSWRVQHPAGSTLSIDEGMVLLTFADSSTQVLSGTPQAQDAQGRVVPAEYSLGTVNGDDVLTLTWHAEALSAFDAPSEAVAYPIDIDPEYLFPNDGHRITPDLVVQNSTPAPASGTAVGCFDYKFEMEFRGRTYTPTTFRTFQGGPNGARANCRLSGPPAGLEWFGFYSDFKWRVNTNQRVILRDSSGASPTDTKGHDLDDYQYAKTGNVQSGISQVLWADNTANGAPFGDVRLFVTTATDSKQKLGDDRGAYLTNMTRVFADYDDPVIADLQPIADDQIVSAGPKTMGISGFDSGIGCAFAAMSITLDNAPAPFFSQSTPGCQYYATLNFTQPGSYTVKYAIVDKLGNDVTETRDFQVANPLASPDNGDPLGGSTTIELELAHDLAYGSVQVWGTSAAGVSFPIGDAYTAPGERSFQWDTTQVQNGAYTIELILTTGSGARLLDSANVTIENAHPMAVAPEGSASSTDIGNGFKVLHATGAVAGISVDVAQTGPQGETFGLARSYHSQDTRSSILGKGWRTSWEQQLKIGPDDAATFIDATGREWVFLSDGGGGWTQAPGQTGELMLNPDVMTLLESPYLIAYPDGRSLAFDADGRLLREQWPAGNAINYGAATATGTNGEQAFTISDDANHVVTGTLNAAGRLVRLSNSEGETWHYTYDSASRLHTAVDPEGGATTYTYDAAGALNKIEDPVHRPTAIAYDTHVDDDSDTPLPRAVTVTDPGNAGHAFDYAQEGQVTETFAGRTTISEFDEQGRLITQTNPAGDESFTDYNDLGQVTDVTDENEDTTSMTYDAAGHVTSEVDGEGNATTYSNFDAFGNARRIENAAHEVTLRSFDSVGNLVSETAPNGSITNWTYENGSSLPASKTDSNNETVSYTYSSTGQPTSESTTDDDGNVHYRERATYDSTGRLTSMRDGDEPATTYEYDEAGRLTSLTDGLGETASVAYDDAGQISSMTDKEGAQTVYAYDARGNLSVELDALGESNSAEYSPHGDLLSLTDERGKKTTFTVNPVGDILTETDPLDRVTTYTYDDIGNLLSEKDPDGFTTSYTVDDNGNTTKLTNPDGSFATAAYSALEDVKSEANELGQATTYTYNDNGQMTTEVDAEGGVWRTKYDSEGREVGFIDAVGAETTFTLDQDARPTMVVNADGTTTQTQYDDAGRVLKTTDERGNVTEMSHDAMGRVLTEQDAEGGVTTYTYDAEGRTKSVTDANGHTTNFTYDLVGQLKSQTDPTGKTTAYTYDPAGNVLTVTDPRGKVTTNVYDAAGQLTKTTDPAGVISTYEYNGRGLLTREATGTKVTKYTYDNRGRATLIEDAELKRTTMTYNVAGDLTSHRGTDQNFTGFTFDKLGRVTREQSALKGISDVTYDASGRVKTRTNSAGTITYTYDLRGRVTNAAFPNGTNATYTYDLTGNLTKIVDAGGTHTFTYDDANRMDSYTTWKGNPMTFGYDAGGRMTSQSFLSNPRAYVYDARDHLTHIDTGRSGGSADYAYDDSGNIVTRTSTNGQVTRYGYDDAGRMFSMGMTGGATQATQYYLYDVQGRRSQLRLSPDNYDIFSPNYDFENQVARYFYTGRGQLQQIRERRDQRSTGFGWDSNGQMTQIAVGFINPLTGSGGTNTSTQNAQVQACVVDPAAANCDATILSVLRRFSDSIPDNLPTGSLTSTENQVANYMRGVGPGAAGFVATRKFTVNARGQLTGLTETLYPSKNHTYTYDTRGNQVTDNGLARTYDYENRLTSYDLASGGTATLTYDANGNLLRVASPSGTTEMEYDPDGRMIHRTEYDASASLVDDSSYYYDEEGLAGLFDGVGGRFYFPLLNPRGDVEALVTTTGAVAARYAYSPYGDIKVNRDASYGDFALRQPFTYNGRDGVQRMPELGGYWMRARYYDPQQTRFLQADPRPAMPGSADTAYSYASNDPIDNADPTGERFTTEAGSRTARQWMPMGNGKVWVGQPATHGNPGYTFTYQSTGSGYSSANLPCSQRPSCRAQYRAEKAAKKKAKMEARRQAKLARIQARADKLEKIRKKREEKARKIIEANNRYIEEQNSVKHRLGSFFSDLGSSSMDTANGLANSVTFGATGSYQRSLGYEANTSSGSYQVGSYAGTASTFVIGGGAAATAIRGTETAAGGTSVARTAISCATNSFLGSTGVWMADGTFKPISLVQIGDMVMATDPATGRTEPRRVELLWAHADDGALYNVTTKHGSVTSTGAHPFWNPKTRRWVAPNDMQIGDRLFTRDGSTPEIVSLDEEPASGRIVYNLTVAGTHTYYVKMGLSAVLVHNCAGAEQKLANILFNINSRGSTAQAVVREAATGAATGGKYHFVKAAESASGLNRLIQSGQLSGASLQRAVAERNQLLAALRTAGISG